MKGICNTVYGRKLMLEELLSSELGSSSFRIDAFYESAKNRQVTSMRASEDGVLHLGINVTFKEDELFSDCEESMELSVIFRAFFISNYVHCLEGARTSVPDSYFSGLVTLESVIDLNTPGRVSCSIPDAYRKNRELRPTDVYCAVRALTRIIMQYGERLSNKAKQRCERYNGILISYTALPETEYRNSSRAEYTALNKLKDLVILIGRKPGVIGDYALLSDYITAPLEKIKPADLLSACKVRENSLWAGLMMRVIVLTDNISYPKDNPALGILKDALAAFDAESVRYFTENKEPGVLLTENRRAVQNLARKAQKLTAIGEKAQSGRVHLIR